MTFRYILNVLEIELNKYLSWIRISINNQQEQLF